MSRLSRRGAIAVSRAPAAVNTLSLPGMDGNHLSTPDSVANSITSSIDIRMKLSMANWSDAEGLAVKWGAAGQRSWRFFNAGGPLQLDISNDGTNAVSTFSTASVSFDADTAHWVRVTWDNATDVVKFYTSEDYDPVGVTGSWTQLGTDSSLAQTGIFNSTAVLAVGSLASAGNLINLNGNVYYFELRDGVNGTVVQSFDATAVTKIGTRNPSSVSAGGPWTINGSAWDWEAV